MARIFKYQEQSWEDPGENFSNEDVKKHLTQFFPELAQATVETKALDDGQTEVRFVKRAGTKGAIKLRIQGLPDDIAEFARFLEEHPDITVYETSQPYANRGTSHYVRAYAEIELDHDAVKNVILDKINKGVAHEPVHATQRAM